MRWQSRMADDVAATRAMVGRAQALLAQTYHRDADGQFASGGGGVRDSLAQAKTTAQVGAVLATELSVAMGRDVHVDLKGMNAAVAREHAEGILRVAEQFPNNELGEVTTFGRRGVIDPATMGLARTAQAVTTDGPDGSNTDRIAFNVDRQPATYRSQLQRGKTVATDPTGVAIHEMGHVVSQHNPSVSRAAQAASDSADAAGEDFFAHARKEISPYAAASEYELTAEGFTAVMIHGASASKLSHQIYDAVVQGNR